MFSVTLALIDSVLLENNMFQYIGDKLTMSWYIEMNYWFEIRLKYKQMSQ